MPLTTTSYAVLGLLDIREWTAYELTQQVRRSLRYLWPVSESQLYAEPKRLASEGLVTIELGPAGPSRTRQVLRITPAGRAALRTWLGTEPAAPRIQMEVLLRVLFAPAATKDELLQALHATRRATEDAYEEGRSVVGAYVAGDNPFPERLHVNVLWMTFVHDLLLLTLRWVDFAAAEVASWPDAGGGADPSRLDRMLQAMLQGMPLLPR